MSRLKSLLLSLLVFSFLSAGLAAIWALDAVQAPGPLATEKLVYIPPGKSTKWIAEKLRAESILQNSFLFQLDARWQSRIAGLKSGEYNFPPGLSIDGAVSLLQSGKTFQRHITLPEGLTVVEIIALLKNEPSLSGEITPPPEGSLLPETYNFSYNDARQDILTRMQKSMQAALHELWIMRAEGLPIATPEEAVILASIVEKETGLAAERPRVAGVFINRLRNGIPLQSDPTVIYAVTQGKEKLMRSLTYKDLKDPSPYNTYVIPGLPPGPIANPGRASLAAVLHPEKNDFIYFVADGTGGHAFARTLKEHNDNVAKWRRLEKQAK